MKRSYIVVFERIADDNWGGWAPDVGGAVGAGDSLEMARQSLREGIGFQLEDLAQRGMDAPPAISNRIDFSELQPDPACSHFEVEWLIVDVPEAGAHTDTATAAAA